MSRLNPSCGGWVSGKGMATKNEGEKDGKGEDNGVYILFHYWYYGQN